MDVLANRTKDYPNEHSVCSSFPSLQRHLNQTNGSITGGVALPEWVTDRWGSNSIGAAEHGMVSAETHGILLSPVQHHWLTETTAAPLEEVHQVPHHSKIERVLSEREGLREFSLSVHQVRSLGRRQPEERDLVELHQKQDEGPGSV